MENFKANIVNQKITPEVYDAAIIHAALNITPEIKNGILATMSLRKQMMTQDQFNEFIDQVRTLLAELGAVAMTCENSYCIIKDVLSAIREINFPLPSHDVIEIMKNRGLCGFQSAIPDRKNLVRNSNK